MSYQEQALAYLRGEMNEEERTAFETTLFESEDLRTELESSRALLDMLQAASQENITKLVNAQIQQAIRDHASDIHIVPEAENGGGQPRNTAIYYRIDGQLQEVGRMPGEQHRALVDRWKIMAEMNVAEQKLPQDGRIICRYQQKEFDLRVSVLPTVTGERITARILDRANVLLDLDKLGMDEATLAAVKRLMERPHGYVILTGAAASGKTTLAYALLRHARTISAPTANILTVEDLVEYQQISGVSQVPVNRRNGLTYATALRSMMRSDPDILYVAECRSQEIAELSIEAAVTGHLVLSVLHTASAVQVVQRLRDIGIVNHLLASNLAGAVGMRLVRRVCPDCAAPYMPSERDLSGAGLSLLEDGPFRKGVGCENCRQTGYRGRIGLFEVMEVEDALRLLIAEHSSQDALWMQAFASGGSLWDDARSKIRQGLITVEDAAWALFDYPQPRHATQSRHSLDGILDLTEL